ncbi:putative holin [Chitinimonas sp.]|uniref:putative holin n=1 Tax=Chitinimonas sp. TaxID=1934313 RepID=UPI0035AFBEE9
MQRDIAWRFIWLVITAVLLMALSYLSPVAGAAPNPSHIAFYKLVLVMLAGCVGYALDVLLFPYGRPDGYLFAGEWTAMEPSADGDADYPVLDNYKMVFAAAMIRRAVIVAACIIGVALGM